MKKYERTLQAGLVRNSDTGKEMTLRNANEHRRLVGHLKDLDLQLHNKLVSMQSEIMELKTSPYGKRINRSARLDDSRERANSDSGLRPFTPIPRGLSSARSMNHLQRKQAPKSLVLPEINVQQTCLVGNSSTKSKRVDCLTTRDISPDRYKQFLRPPSATSLCRPSSLPDLRDVEGKYRLSPIMSRKGSGLQDSTELQIEQQRLSTKVRSSSLTQNTFESKTFDPKIADKIQEKTNDKHQFIVPEITRENTNNDNDDDEKTQSSDEVNSVFYNSLLTKASFSDDELEITPDLASMGFMDFNDVIDKRLQLSQQEPPSEEDMRKVRYLRWATNEKETDLVEAVFAKREVSLNGGDSK